ncbi:hypothetical protein SAMN04515694_11980 [Leifsonia sp. CL154]|nr:hypothetical protein SAMN04515694_11980 [Leifsonia sp. CL154]
MVVRPVWSVLLVRLPAGSYPYFVCLPAGSVTVTTRSAASYV